MRKWSKRILSVILAAVFVFGNIDTTFAQSDLYGETELASEEGMFHGNAETVIPDDPEDPAGLEDEMIPEEPAGAEEGFVQIEPADAADADPASEDTSALTDDTDIPAEETEEEVFATGYVVPEDYRDPETVEENSELLRSSYLESRYVDEDMLNAIPLRNQGIYSTCWAMSSIGLAEFSLYKQGLNLSPDLSELHLAYFTYNSALDPLGGTAGDQSKDKASSGILYHGGEYGHAVNALAGWLGAADEEKAPYSDASTVNSSGTLAESLAFDDSVHLRNAYRVNLRTNPDLVKKLIKKHGAAGIRFYALNSTSGATNGDLYNASTNSYYCSETRQSNHGVMIVGWDDCYSRENFSKDPGSDGAWLVRNSWTTGYYNDKQQYKGYFWMSYMDQGLSSEAFVLDFEKAGDFDNNYQYDGGIQSSSSSAVEKGANIFTIKSPAQGAEELGAVTVATFGTNVKYNVDIYKDLKNRSNPESGTKVASESGMFVYTGYHRVALSHPVTMDKGTVFSVVVTLQNGQIQYEVSSSNSNATYSASAESGQSFSYMNRAWEDFGSVHKGNLRIKAFTNDIGDAPESFITDIIFAGEPGTGLLTINQGDTFEVGYTAVPETAEDKRVTWSSADPGIATVDNHGVVTAECAGRTRITATARAGGVTESFDVVVTRNLTGLDITSPAEGKLTAGKTYTLSAEAVPTAADFSGNVTWTSSDPGIATVDDNGKLDVLGTGAIRLTAEADGVSGTGDYMCILAAPVISAAKSGQTVNISVEAVTGANSYVIYRKIPGDSGTTVSEIQTITAEPERNVYTCADDITGLDIPKGYLVYEVKAAGDAPDHAADSRTSVKVAISKSSYTITYETGAGSNSARNSTQLVNGEVINLYPPIAPVGYSAIGWYEANCDRIITSLPLKVLKSYTYTYEYRNYTVTARYNPNKYRIAYYPNGGTGSMSDTIATYGERVKLSGNLFKRQGSTFAGWNTLPDGKGKSYKNKESVLNLTTESGGTIRLYAQWKTPVASVSLSESSLALYSGESATITETVLPVHANTRDVQWTSSNASVASVDEDGVVRALSKGVATITCKAKDGSGKKATCSVTVKTRVTAVQISAPKRLAMGKTYKIIPAFNNGDSQPSDQTLAWSSSDAFVATVAQNGTVTAGNAGTVTIKAVSAEHDTDNNEIDSSCDIRVYEPVASVKFDGKTASVGGNAALMLHATVTPAVRDDDPEYQGVTFVSSNPDYLSVVEVTDGNTAKLQANLPEGVDKATVKVTATAKDGSGKNAICTVTVVRAVTDITISAPGGQDRIAVGKTLKLAAVISPDNAVNKQVEWVSSAPAVASVDKNGTVKALAVGEAVITARSAVDNSMSATYSVQTYRALTAVSLNATAVTVRAGQQYKLDLTPKPADAVLQDVTYSVTAGDSYITVDDSGLITAAENLDGKPSQRATVMVSASDGVTTKSSKCNVTVTKDPVPVNSVKLNKTTLSMGLGAVETIVASVLPETAGNRNLVEPVLDKDGIVAVTDMGDGSYDIKAIGKGTAVVKFISSENAAKSATCKITVGNPVDSVAIGSAPAGLAVGKKTSLQAVVSGVGGKAASASVEWTIQSAKDAQGNPVSDPSEIATINEKGLVSANGAGEVIIRATAEKPYGVEDTDTKYYDECTIRTYIPVSKITVNRTGLNIRKDATAWLFISALEPENATDQTIRWASSNENVVKIVTPESAITDTAGGDRLEIMAVGTGSAKITGTTTDGSKKSVTVTVKVTGSMIENDVAITLKKIPGNVQVDQDSLSTKDLVITGMPVKRTVTLTPVLTAYAADRKVSFRSSDPNIATVNASGVVSAKAPGTAVIIMRTADGGYEARCSVTVSGD